MVSMSDISTAVPVQLPGVTWRLLGGQAVAVTSEDRKLHTFENEVATGIWTRIDGQATIEQITSAILDEFAVDEQTARQDVTAFLELLQARGLIALR
jgi:hypothetical protein